MSLLFSQLETERAIYEKLSRSNRNDAVAKIVLARVASEIKKIEGKINVEGRQKSVESRLAGRLIQYVRKTLYRFWHYKNRRHYSLFRVFAKATISKKAVA